MINTKEELKQYLLDNNMTQSDLCKKSGKSESTVTRWLNGERNLPKNINYLLGLVDKDEFTKDTDNIIKRVCSVYNLTYAQLAEVIGYESTSINNAARSEVSKPMRKAIELYMRNIELEEELRKSNLIKATLKEWLVWLMKQI